MCKTSPFGTPSARQTNGLSRRSVPEGDSLDNALAETVDGLCKTELIYRQGLWKTMEQVETSDNLVDQLVERVAPLRGLRLGASSEVRGEPLPSPGRGPVGRVKPNNRASIKS